jgi:hypothetical protein
MLYSGSGYLIDEFEDVFCVDSKPVEICRISRSSRNKVGKTDSEKAPCKGFCASQNRYYYGYKLHAVCGLKGVIHSFERTKVCNSIIINKMLPLQGAAPDMLSLPKAWAMIYQAFSLKIPCRPFG